jgi:hypothetical protein
MSRLTKAERAEIEAQARTIQAGFGDVPEPTKSYLAANVLRLLASIESLEIVAEEAENFLRSNSHPQAAYFADRLRTIFGE